MGKVIYFINAFLGILVGLFVVAMGIIGYIQEGFNPMMIGLIIGGVLSISFGIYEWKKFRGSSVN